jgi:glycosyltransferase involved in cell wall biosynthesis
MRDDVASVTVLCDSREVKKTYVVEDGKLSVVFLPKIELRRTDPLHLYLPARIRMRRWLETINPHIVHGHGTEAECGFLATRSGYPNVVTIQGIISELDKLLGWPRWKQAMSAWLERKVIMEADGLIVSSNWSRRWALQYRGKEDIQFIPNVVSPEFLQQQSDYARKRILCVGTLSHFKDPLTVIRAFATADVPDSELVMIGDGPLEGACRQESIEKGIGDRVIFTGRLERNDIVGYMLHARCLAIGSRIDTSPNVVIEALSMGVPVVGTDAAGVPDMFVDGEEGFVVPVGSVEQMASGMRELLISPDRGRHMGIKGMKRVRHQHAPAYVASTHVNWYRKLIEDKASNE